jgi:gamma-glutamyl:cysteine ligase YbdK (ATP-grasp superfamily)
MAGIRSWLTELPADPRLDRREEEYARFVELLVRTGCIDDGKKIWWDIRPHAYFKTLEFRVCDIPCPAEETVAIAALSQALVCNVYRLIEKNLSVRYYNRAIVMENKFRALKRGLDGSRRRGGGCDSGGRQLGEPGQHLLQPKAMECCGSVPSM